MLSSSLTTVEVIISEAVRTAIRNSGMSVNELGIKSKVAQSVIARFMHGTDLRLQTADRIAKFLRLKLVQSETR